MSISILILSLHVNASICKFSSEHKDNTNIRTGSVNNGSECYIYITHRDNFGLVYRTHYFDTTGKYMIFNSYGAGPVSTKTGARVYQFLSDKLNLSKTIKNNKLEVVFLKNLRIQFDLNTTYIDGGIGLDIAEDRRVSSTNSGGVLIENSSIPIIDHGFMLGNTPLWNLNNEFLYQRSKNHKLCKGLNKELYFKKGDELVSKFSTVFEKIKYLNSICRTR